MTTPDSSTATISPEQARLKAEARAYALSGTKRKSPPTSAAASHSARAISAATAMAATSRSSAHKPQLSRSRGPIAPAPTATARPTKQLKPTISPCTTVAGSYKAPAGITASAALPNFPLGGSEAMNRPPAIPPSASATVFSGEDDEYERFVKSLLVDDGLFFGLDDDEDFRLSDAEDDDDDDDDEDFLLDSQKQAVLESTPPLASPLSASPLELPDFDADFDLEQELGSLLEEDLEAAVTTLLTSKKPSTSNLSSVPASRGPSASLSSPGATTNVAAKKGSVTKAPNGMQQQQLSSNQPPKTDTESPTTPLREASRQSAQTRVTYQQSQQLRRLMTKHYQLLVQQAILAVRAAHVQKQHKDKTDFLSGETADDLAEILDGAVGMLQDLDQVRG
jgi:hypothetical protein